jgi:hypothetical protein
MNCPTRSTILPMEANRPYKPPIVIALARTVLSVLWRLLLVIALVVLGTVIASVWRSQAAVPGEGATVRAEPTFVLRGDVTARLTWDVQAAVADG